MNFLEQLAREWYEINGYFVKTNLKYGKRSKGGWTGEMDVAAFHPGSGELIHIETSSDASDWETRRQRFSKKFETARGHLKELFPEGVRTVRQIAVVGFSAVGRKAFVGDDVEVKSLPQFVREIAKTLRTWDLYKRAIPEGYPLLRAMQFALHWTEEKCAPDCGPGGSDET